MQSTREVETELIQRERVAAELHRKKGYILKIEDFFLSQIYFMHFWLQLFPLFLHFFKCSGRPAVVFVRRCCRVAAPHFLPVDCFAF